MSIKESNFSNQIIKHTPKKLGDIFFFNHIAVVEFNEGVHVDINNSEEIFDEIKLYFGNARPFGVISNRINSYSVKLLDSHLFRAKVKNLRAYAVVGYNSASKMNAKIENAYCISDKVNYDSIYEAVDVVYRKVKRDIQTSLN
ncbi:MAG: hypothetical protein ABJL44_08880 [Algibacter sp.]